MSDTPRTDAREAHNGNVLCGSANLDFARTLERELAEAQHRIAVLEANNARLLDACRAALSLLEDPDGDEFKANAVADQLQKAITK